MKSKTRANKLYKNETKKAYNKYAKKFEEKFHEYSEAYIKKEAKLFADKVGKKGRVLDMGSGPGDHAVYLKKNNLDVLCIDISKEMIKLCKQKGLNARVMDFEKMHFKQGSFNGVWAYTSLLHIPKSRFPITIKKISRILKPNGVLFLGMKYGNEEGFVSSEKYPGTKRWFSNYTDTEIRSSLKPYFKIVSSYRTKIRKGQIFLNYLCIAK
jgi:ubiquinone/menaquinone biosynthesis C-methylase UbiE